MRSILIHNTSAGMVITASSIPSLNSFRAKARVVSGTYAHELVDRFYEYLFFNAINLSQDYKKYYKPEYSTMQSYLYHKYGLSENHVQALNPFIEEGAYLGLVEDNWGKDYQMQSFIGHCAVGVKSMMTAVGLKWAEKIHED